VDTSSVNVLDDIKEKDRLEIEHTMLKDGVEASTYPQIAFQTTSITATRITESRYKARIICDFSPYGVTP
jgi:polyisoprenoid-binding protein YceI